ncbi:MAG: hypothetical protein KatS3mg026_0282 [Bacteroidia bacterium]|nr:MAG: hypothetical protein KatS3mg026_0282 [Bacteroidia bacterium]
MLTPYRARRQEHRLQKNFYGKQKGAYSPLAGLGCSLLERFLLVRSSQGLDTQVFILFLGIRRTAPEILTSILELRLVPVLASVTVIERLVLRFSNRMEHICLRSLEHKRTKPLSFLLVLFPQTSTSIGCGLSVPWLTLLMISFIRSLAFFTSSCRSSGMSFSSHRPDSLNSAYKKRISLEDKVKPQLVELGELGLLGSVLYFIIIRKSGPLFRATEYTVPTSGSSPTRNCHLPGLLEKSFAKKAPWYSSCDCICT